MNADNRRYARDDLTKAIIGVFFEVYNELGYGSWSRCIVKQCLLRFARQG